MDAYHITFYGYNGTKQVAKIETEMSVVDFPLHCKPSIKAFILEHHPEGNKLNMTNAFASIGKVAYFTGEQLELF